MVLGCAGAVRDQAASSECPLRSKQIADANRSDTGMAMEEW